MINKLESSRYGVTKTSLGIVFKKLRYFLESFTDMSQIFALPNPFRGLRAASFSVRKVWTFFKTFPLVERVFSRALLCN